MPTIKNIPGAYRLFFYSFDCYEPMHVHIQRDKMTCKYWLASVSLAKNTGFSPVELNKIRKLIVANHHKIIEVWHEHCG